MRKAAETIGRPVYDPDIFERSLAAIPTGCTFGIFEGRRWSATKKLSADGRRIWLFAEQLGASGIVSFNAYRLADGTLAVKPCEMSLASIVEFISHYQCLDVQQQSNIAALGR